MDVGFVDEQQQPSQKKRSTVRFVDEPQPDTFENIVKGTLGEWDRRASEIRNLDALQKQGQITMPEKYIAGLGQVLMAPADVMGGAVNAADFALGRIPSTVGKKAVDLFGRLPTGFGGKARLAESVPQEIAGAVDAYTDWKQKNPRKARMGEAALNIMSSLSAPITREPIKKTGQSLLKSADDQVLAKYVKKISPIPDKNVRRAAQMQGRIKQSLFLGEDVLKPEETTLRAAQILKEKKIFGGLFKSDAVKGNLIKQQADKIASDLYDDLGSYNNIKFKDSYVKANIFDKIRQDLSQDRTLISESGQSLVKSIDDYVKQAEDIVNKNPKTLQGLYKSRREFDDYLNSKNILPHTEAGSSAKEAKRRVRTYLNKFIDQHAQNKNFSKRLFDASSLYEAAENVADTVAAQGNTPAKRFVASAERAIPGKTEMGDATILYALSKIPGVTITASGVYFGGKILNSTMTKKIVGNVLKSGDIILDQATKDALQDYLTELQSQDEETLKQPAKNAIKNKSEVR